MHFQVAQIITLVIRVNGVESIPALISKMAAA